MLKTSLQTLKSLPIVTKQQPPRFTKNSVVMEAQSEKVYAYYNHTDSCKFSRWTARESFEFMYARPWQEVVDFYSKSVNGRLSLLELFGTQAHDVHVDDKIEEVSNETALLEGVSNVDKSGRWARVTFKIVLSYHGGSFDGWQKQPGLNTVQGLVEKSLGIFVDEKKAQQLKEKSKPLEGCASVAGRTDKGVSALQQVCSFYTWRKDVKPHEIEDAINDVAPGKVRVVSVSEVSRAFHPNFSAKWRHYLYIFPLNDGENREEIEVMRMRMNLKVQRNLGVSVYAGLISSLHQLEGKLLSYKNFARDTKALRNVGPPTECYFYHARATETSLPCPDHGKEIKVMCVELVANRFLRKMVRVLVATAVREAAAGAQEDALLKLMDATCRRATAPPAPPDGLCLVNVGYTEFDRQNCLIP
ncbi:hypothetical protein OIU76_027208 [Salix suchowensis]|nr:hypothetical protein OIU76_027208 [Salix suchowensis]